MSFNIPDDLQYTKTHEWIRIEGDEATIGVTDYAQHSLGDVVFTELPEVGASYDAEDRFGTIESVKAASEIYLPVAGTVIAVNSDLDAEPELINEDSYGDGWLIKIKVTPGVGALMSADAYSRYLEGLEN